MIVIANNLNEDRWIVGHPNIERKEIAYVYVWTREERTRLLKDFRRGIKKSGKRLKMPDHMETSKKW
jgi:hypothetical protein